MCMACDLLAEGVDCDSALVAGIAIGFLYLTEEMPINLCDVHKKDWHTAFSSLQKTWQEVRARLTFMPEINTIESAAGGRIN